MSKDIQASLDRNRWRVELFFSKRTDGNEPSFSSLSQYTG